MTSSDPERGDNSAANGQQTCASRSADEAAKRATTEDGQTQTHAQAAVSSSDRTVSPTDRNSDKSEPETASSGMVSCYLTVLLQSYTERETVTAWSAVIRLCLALIDTTRSLAVTDCLSRVVETLKCSLGWESLKIIDDGTIRKLRYGFVCTFHNYGRFFSRFHTMHQRDRHPPYHHTTAYKRRLCIALRGNMDGDSGGTCPPIIGVGGTSMGLSPPKVCGICKHVE